MTWRMNSVPSVWGPEHSIWARCMEGVRNAAAHCSKTAGSHGGGAQRCRPLFQNSRLPQLVAHRHGLTSHPETSNKAIVVSLVAPEGPPPAVCCVVLRCVALCCAEGAVTRRQWPGCLPAGTGKREGCVCSARAVCKCVVIGGKRGSRGKPGCHPPGDSCHPKSSRYTPSLSACWCKHSSCNTHAIVLPGPRPAFGNVARALAWARL